MKGTIQNTDKVVNESKKIKKSNSFDETAYLLNNPANAKRLLKSIEDYDNGLGKQKDLIE